MEFKTIQNKTFTFQGNTIKYRPYLKAEEIAAIVDNMLQKDDYLQRIIIRDVMIVHFCTDVVVTDEDGAINASYEMYNMLNNSGFINTLKDKINHYDLFMIEDYIEKSESINVFVKEFLDNISDNINKSEEDIIGMTEKFNELLQNVNKAKENRK